MLNVKLFCSVCLCIALTGVLPVRAQYYSVNYDYATIGAMVAAFGTEAATEALHQQNTSKILDSYTSAEVATAGIFASKLLDRNALKSASGFNTPDENYYYNKIYRIVANKVIPRTISVTQKLLRDPVTAIHWGPHLLRVMTDTKSLCQQFSAVVTNSELNFNDVPFLEFTQTIQNVINLTGIGNVDFMSFFDNLGNIGSQFTASNLETEFGNLENLAVGLAGAGGNNENGSLFNDTFQGNVGQISGMVSGQASMFDQFANTAGNTINGLLSSNMGDLSNVLTSTVGGDNSWISQYNNSSNSQYYTQRVYIYHTDSGSEQIAKYTPPTDDNSILYGDHWYRIDTTDPNFYPDANQREVALQNSEAHAGWSRNKVNQMNQTHDGYNYSISYWSSAYILSRSKSGQYAKAYAYEITVNRSWYNTETYYEETFDSYSQNWTVFMNAMNARLEEANRNEEGERFYIGYDSKRYYQATDARKVAGASSATFTLTCHSDGKIAEGNIQYKCSRCGGSPNEHTKQCSMATSLSGGDFDYSEINNAIADTERQMQDVQRQIDALNSRNKDILSQLSKVSNEEATALRNEYSQNRQKIQDLQSQYDQLNETLNGYKNAKAEAQQFESTQTDSSNRIPSVMLNLRNNFQLEWLEEGHWEGFTFVRKANMRNMKSEVIFKATISISRGPKYFLGIKIHRAIVRIEWELDANYNDSQVIEVMQLDPNGDSNSQAEQVNRKLAEYRNQYPDCTVEVTYERSTNVEPEEEDDDDKIHLLWASDRLDIARDICHRLELIYSDLVVLDKYLHYKYSILDWLQDQTINRLNTERGKRLTIAERSRKRWMHNAGSAIYEREEEDDEYDE